MANWRTYRITNKTASSNYILFNLDNFVNYSNSNGSNNYKHIYCSNLSPFYNWRENDFIEIDNDVTCYRESGHHFNSIGEVRLSCHGCGHSQTEYDDLKTRCSALERERNDFRSDRDTLCDDRDKWIRKYEELRKQSSDELNAEKLKNANEMANEKLARQSTESTLRSEKTLIKKDLTNARNEIASLKNLVEEGRNELNQKNEEIRRIEETLANLRIENEREKVSNDTEINGKVRELSEKENELRLKEEEIQELRSQKGLSQEELLIEKLRSEKVNLESFAIELKIDLEKVWNLINDHKQLLQAQKTHNQTNINTYENNIVRTKKGLQNSEVGVGIITIQEICRKCERIAELNWELSQIQQQYQAQQEIPTNQ